jgi:hypothetical protein
LVLCDSASSISRFIIWFTDLRSSLANAATLAANCSGILSDVLLTSVFGLFMCLH